MQRDEIRKTVTAQFYQSLAESDVQIDAIPPKQLQAIVNGLADGMIAALVAMEDEEEQVIAEHLRNAGTQTTGEEGEEGEETLVWSGRPYLSIGLRYELTTQRLRIIRGLLGRTMEEIELVRVRDTTVSQHMGERALNVGDITIVSNDPSQPQVVLNNVKNPVDVREMIRKATMEEKKRRGLRYREEM